MGSLEWYVHKDAALAAGQASAVRQAGAGLDQISSGTWEELGRRLAWRYPYAESTTMAAKSSVSQLRRQVALEADEAAVLIKPQQQTRRRPSRAPAAAAETGLAHHRFMQLVALDQTGSGTALKADAIRLREAGALSAEEIELIDFAALARFWDSELGRRVRAQAPSVRRELEFTARFGADELAGLLGKPGAGQHNDFVVVQGIADLVVLLPEEIWLLDFKTDAITHDEVESRAKLYAPQVMLYAKALVRIYGRPVTETWLYFLAANMAVRVGENQTGPKSGAA